MPGWFEKLKDLKKKSGLSTGDISDSTGIATGTLDKIFSGRTKSPGINTIQTIVHAMGFTLDDLEANPARATKTALSLSDEAMKLASDYDILDPWGKKLLRSMADIELARKKEPVHSAPAKPVKVIPLLGTSFAAGTTEPESDIPWEDLEVNADSKAEFAIHINGNSMEPYLPDGSIAYGVKRAPQDGEVAALLLDGDFICKQVCQDMVGNLYLFALNRARKDADQQIMHDAERSITCFGTIIMDPVPLPQD